MKKIKLIKTKAFKKIILLVLFSMILLPNISLAATCLDAGGSCQTSCSAGTLPGAYDPCPLGQVCCAPVASTPSSPTASPYTEGSTGGFLLLEGHLVPCGRSTNDPGTPNIDETNQCTLCHLFLMSKNVFDLIFSLVIVAAILFITIGGVVYIVSTGNSNLVAMAKNIIKKTLIGFTLMLAGWLLVYTLLTFLSTGDMVGKGTGSWFEFSCEEESTFGSGTMIGYTTGTPDSTDYTFDAGIASQTADASAPLQTLLSCMRDKLPSEAKVISSISDSAGMANCIAGSYSQPPCAHTENSCHYGGTSCAGESYAVDFGNESYAAQIINVAKTCNSGAYTRNEGNHIHISIGAVNGCGCN